MGLVNKLGIDFRNSRLHPRLALKEQFKVKSMKHWKLILENNPISFANVRHPFERLAREIYFNVFISPHIDRETTPSSDS